MKLSKVLILCVLTIILFSSSSFAQLSTGGQPHSFAVQAQSSVPSVVMADVDVAKLLAEDEQEEKLGVPMRFGFPFDVNYNLLNSGVWETMSDGWKVWRFRIEAPGAKSINLLYDNFWLPEGAKFYLYSEDQQMTIGAYTAQNNKEHGEFATSPVKGEVTILELNVPPEVSYPGEISISRIVHDYRDILKLGYEKGFGSSGSCNNNVNCPEGDDWQNQKRSVAMVILGSGTRWCSGSMINNVRQDLTPYFLTADHCTGSSNTWIIMFNYESPNCSNINGPTWMTVQGTTMKAQNAFSDFALVELNETPPDSFNLFYAGWSAIDINADSVVGIHHPAGDIKKISFDYGQVSTTTYLQSSVPGNGSHWRVGNWEDGTTEGGSSGSPIYNRDGQIIGQLHGGYASCTSITPDWYGKFSQSWDYGSSISNRLMDWLDPDNTGALVLNGRDAVGIKITHTPLTDTRDSLNDYEVLAMITSDTTLNTDSLFVYYDNGGGFVEILMTAAGSPDEYSANIPAQSPGTTIDYYLLAIDDEGKADTTDTFQFFVIDYGVSISPGFDSKTGAVYDSVFYTLSITNTGLYDDEYILALSNNSWTTTIWDETFSTVINSTGVLSYDEVFNFLVMVEVPSSLYGDNDSAVVTATSLGDASYEVSSSLVTVSDGEPFTIPFEDEFPTASIDAGKWVLNANVESNQDGLNEPSGLYSMNLDGNTTGRDTVMSQAIDLKDESNIIVRYFYQITGGGDAPETGDDLFVEYYDSTGNWILLNQHPGSLENMTEFIELKTALPGNAYHSSFRLRFRNIATSGDFDDWFVDDVYVGVPAAYEVRLTPQTQSGYGPSGDTAAYQLTIINTGSNDDSYDLSASDNIWDVSFFDESGTTQITNTALVIGGDSTVITAKVAIPGSSVMSDSDNATITATSQADPLVDGTATVTTSSAGLPGGFPWFEPFPDDTLITSRWFSIVGTVISTDGLLEPSGPYSLNLDGGIDTAITQVIDLSGQTDVILSYYYQRGGGGDAPEVGDDLVFEYKNNLSVWSVLNTHDGSDPVMIDFEYVSVGLPSDAYYNGFQVRIHSYGSGAAADDWYVDDIRIDFAPSISYSNQSMVHTLLIGDTTVSEMTIENIGLGGLNYSINIVPILSKSSLFANLLSTGNVEPARRLYPEGFDNYHDIKGSDDPRIGFPVEKNGGGPDVFGYFWIDSDEPGGPAFDWVDVSGSGTDVIAALSDDNFGGPYQLGFDFIYYGNTYNEIYVGSNGMIGFSSNGLNSRFKTSIPTSGTPNNMICWMWDDLDPTDDDNLNGHVYVDTTGGRCVIQFVDYPEYSASPGDVITAEVIIESDGTIILQYLTIAAGFDVASGTVGIENPDGTDGLEIAYLTAYLHDSLTVLITAPYSWLKADKTSGNLLTGESDIIEFEFTTGSMVTGVYQSNIVITSNDPNNNPVIIPAELTVTDIPPFICGDIDNNSEGPDIADLVYLVDYQFGQPSGPPPPIIYAADVNADDGIDIADLVYMVDYMFGDPQGPDLNCP